MIHLWYAGNKTVIMLLKLLKKTTLDEVEIVNIFELIAEVLENIHKYKYFNS